MSRKVVWIVFLAALALTFGLKAVQLGWFAPRLPLELDDRPALLFFNSQHGCECALAVYRAAEAQVNAWDDVTRQGVHLIRLDVDQRPDLVRRFQVARAPTLILLDAAGQIVWRQDDVVSDLLPLDLASVESQLAAFASSEKIIIEER